MTRYSSSAVSLYEYACKNCSRTFEEVSPRPEGDATCPKCGTSETSASCSRAWLSVAPPDRTRLPPLADVAEILADVAPAG